MSEPLLTIAVPTYNRAAFLLETLGGICSQSAEFGELIEIFVSDNASSDGTESLCQGYRGTSQQLRYERQSRNLGSEANVMHVMRSAKGRWVWMFGDDDILLQGGVGAVIRILKAASADLGLVLLNYGQVRRDGVSPLCKRVCEGQSGWTGTLQEFVGFRGSFDILGFITAFIARRDLIDWSGSYEGLHSYYPHVGYIIQSFYRRRCVFYVAPIVNQRQENQRTSEDHGDQEKAVVVNVDTFVGLTMMLKRLSEVLRLPDGELEAMSVKTGYGDVSVTETAPVLDWAFDAFVRSDLFTAARVDAGLDLRIEKLVGVIPLVSSRVTRRRLTSAVSSARTAAAARLALYLALEGITLS